MAISTVPGTRVVLSSASLWRTLDRMNAILHQGQLAQGSLVADFEKGFVAVQGQPGYCVATSSCTTALEIIYRCLRVEGREVIVPANTFHATAAAVLHAGGRPVFCDIDPDRMVANWSHIEAKITPNTAAVCYVHIAGQVDPSIEHIAGQLQTHYPKIKLIEDCAHAAGASLHGRYAGRYGVAAAFSFYATKVLTCGEGGCIITNDNEINVLARTWRDHGKLETNANIHVLPGGNWRMSELHAALGLSQLEDFRNILIERQRLAQLYLASLSTEPQLLRVCTPDPFSMCNWYKLVVVPRLRHGRTDLEQYLARQGIGLAGEVFRTPLHKQPSLAYLHPENTKLPGVELFAGGHICLPLWPGLSDEQVGHVCKILLDYLRDGQFA